MNMIGKGSQYWFEETFRPSIVAPGDALLTYREVGFWSRRSRSDKTICNAIVVCTERRQRASYLES